MHLERPSDWALFLDLDGTVIDIASTPDGVSVSSGLVESLSLLARGLDGAIAIVTGRRIAEADRLLAPLKLIAAGVHGAELRVTAGGEIASCAEPLPVSLMAAVTDLCRDWPGVLLEPKRSSIAVHYRAAVPAAGPALEQALQRLLESTADHLILCHGRKVLEVVPKDISKGAALESMAELTAFRSRRPIMIGDDISDETAFDAAVRLDGLALRVAGEHFTKDTAQFESPAQVRRWLAELAQRVGA